MTQLHEGPVALVPVFCSKVGACGQLDLAFSATPRPLNNLPDVSTGEEGEERKKKIESGPSMLHFCSCLTKVKTSKTQIYTGL